MSASLVLPPPIAASRIEDATTESAAIRWLLTGIALAFLAVFLFLPLVAVFSKPSRRAQRSILPRWSSPTRSLRSSSPC